MLRPKKNSYKEFDNEKKFLRLKNSPPHNLAGVQFFCFLFIYESYQNYTNSKGTANQVLRTTL